MSYVHDCHKLYLVDQKKGIRKTHHDFNEKKSKCQKTSHEKYSSMNFSEKTNILDYTPYCT